MSDKRIPLPVTADLSDSMRDDESDAWVVDSDAGSLCEMTCPAEDAKAYAEEIATALNTRNEILAELRWYGKCIAGGGPVVGFEKVARRANAHWYGTTLPLLQRLNAVYANDSYNQQEGSNDKQTS